MKNKIVIILVFFFFSCQKEKKASFKTFEISYTDGWISDYSFLIDSTGKYYCKRLVDYPSIGKLPDSIFFQINNLSHEILRIKKFDSIKNNCFDCSILSIKVKDRNEEIIIYQKGNVDKKYNKLTFLLGRFLEKVENRKKDTLICFETESAIVPPMPLPYSEYKKRKINK